MPRSSIRYGSVLAAMLSRHRGVLAAIAGLILLAASPPGQRGEGEQHGSQAAAEKSLQDIATALQDANKSDGTTEPCPKDQEDRSSDLCAQWKAADAAGASAVWTERTFWLSTAGLVIGFMTLVAAGAAAFYAYRAADAGREANRISERTLTDLEQPYLFVDKILTNTPITLDWIGAPDDLIFEAAPKIRNHGRTPAVVIESYAHIYIGNELPKAPFILDSDLRKTEQVIPPGEPYALPTFYRYKLTKEVVEDLFMSRNFIEGVKPTRCYIYGYVRYASPYGVTDEFGFIWEFLVINDAFIQRHIPNYTYRKRLAPTSLTEQDLAARDDRGGEGEGE